MLVLSLPLGTATEVHQLQKVGGDVVRPQVLDLPGVGEMIPLARVRFVDVNTTVPLADQTGTIARPFATIQAAVDALPAPGGVIMIAPGSYTEASVVVPGTKVISFVGCAPNGFGAAQNVTLTNSISSSADLGVFGLTVSNAIITSQRLTMDSVAVTNVTATNGCKVTDCSVSNISAPTGSSILRDSTFANNCSFQATDMQGCSFTGGIPVSFSQALTARFCSFTPNLSCATTANFWKCRLLGTTAVTGALTTDLDSISHILAVLSFGSCVLVGPSAAKISVSVVVPAVAAGQVGYVDVNLVGTALAGLATAGSMLVANPTADLVAAGAGGGFINVRASAANTARFAFVGPLAGGASNFLLGVT